GRPEVERGFVEPPRRGERPERVRAITRVARGEPGRLDQRGRLLRAGRASQLQRLEVVVGEHLRVVIWPAERVDPGGGPLVPLGAHSARDLSVGDIADEDVAERVLVLAAD